MLFQKTKLAGIRLIDLQPASDDRGFFARIYCEREFTGHGLVTSFPQHSTSFNARKGTLRGMHYQRAPHGETKVVRCTSGSIFDVVVDVRDDSPTRGQWQGFELSADNRRAVYIAEGFAHGFQALTENAEVTYMISAFHVPDAAAGFRYDDPAIGIVWPLPVSTISPRDLGWPGLMA